MSAVKTAGRKSATKPEQKSVTLHFDREKETKTCQRFKERGDSPVVGVLYVKQDTDDILGNPESVKMILSAND
jgi:hypothetical protein